MKKILLLLTFIIACNSTLSCYAADNFFSSANGISIVVIVSLCTILGLILMLTPKKNTANINKNAKGNNNNTGKYSGNNVIGDNNNYGPTGRNSDNNSGNNSGKNNNVNNEIIIVNSGNNRNSNQIINSNNNGNNKNSDNIINKNNINYTDENDNTHPNFWANRTITLGE